MLFKSEACITFIYLRCGSETPLAKFLLDLRAAWPKVLKYRLSGDHVTIIA